MTNSGKNIDVSKEDSVHQNQDQSESKKLMSSAIDIGTKEATLQPETTVTLVKRQKAERYHLKSYARYFFLCLSDLRNSYFYPLAIASLNCICCISPCHYVSVVYHHVAVCP